MSLRDRLADFVNNFKFDGDAAPSTYTGILDTVYAVVDSLMKIADAFEAPGADKKAAVVAATADFYQKFIKPIDLPWIPNFLETTVVDPLLEREISLFAGWIVERIYRARTA